MKYRVIGWTDFEEAEIKDGPESYAACNAIIDEIKEKGYMFTGGAHRERSTGVPVLNDGKKRTFSQRGWGSIMAEAHGYLKPMDYSIFAFSNDPWEEEMPPIDSRVNIDELVPEADLNEEIIIKTSGGVYEKAENELVFLDYDAPALRYIDVEDTLTLLHNDRKASYKVSELERGWDKNDGKGEIDPILGDEMSSALYLADGKEKERLKLLFEKGAKIIRIELKK